MFLNNNLLKKIPLSFSKGSVGDSLYLNNNHIEDLDDSFRNFIFKNKVDLSQNLGHFKYLIGFNKNELKNWLNRHQYQ